MVEMEEGESEGEGEAEIVCNHFVRGAEWTSQRCHQFVLVC